MMNAILKNIGFLAVTACASFSDAENVTVISYHENLPYDTRAENNLTRSFIDLLEQKSQGTLKFHVVFMKRSELNKHLENGESAVVVWANPLWFSKQRGDLIYSDYILWDANDFISVNGHEDEISSLADLQGATIVAHVGHYYRGVDEYVRAGKTQRVDVTSITEMVQVLARHDADIGIINRSMIRYYEKNNARVLHTSKTSHDAYFLHIMATNDNQTLMNTISDALRIVKKSPEWKQTLHRFGMNELVDFVEFEFVELLDINIGQ